MKDATFILTSDMKPQNKTFVEAVNFKDEWMQLAYYDKDEFWIADGPLKGMPLPFVEGWRLK